jgi:hypothetical protein
MHKISDSSLAVGSLCALLGALACSAEPSNDSPAMAAPFGGTPSNTDTSTNPNQPSQMTPGTVMGSGGTEGQSNPSLTDNMNVGMNTGGAGGMLPPVVDAPPQATPGGYFESGSWHGYAWTGDDGLALGTTRSVQDYTMLPAGDPFCLSGNVGPDPDVPVGTGYQGVALLGFNVAQEKFAPVEGQEPPIGAIAPTGLGVAVNYTKSAGQILRIQLQGPNGATVDSERWCAELTAVQGPAFIPYTSFRTQCWLAAGAAGSVTYARQPLSAVVMTIPGDDADPVPYNVCIAGFADGNTVADAPASISLAAGLLSGTLSAEAARIKVVGKDGESYVINNNAWGDNSSDGSQQIRFTGNSFEVLRQTAGPGANSSPASFPSIFIGANGATSGVNGASTTGDNPLPIRISDIQTLPTTFNISGTMGDNNAAYDVWFANTAPTGQYDTAQSAFLMVWTHRPAQRSPIGTNNVAFETGQTVQGVPGTWDLWVGRRGGNGPDANNPVINYVAPSTVRAITFDLKLFIQDAVNRSQTGRLNGFTFSDQLLLTDVFAGFEIWSGGAGLKVDEFSAQINP